MNGLTALEFRYRYVPFGTRFHAVSGFRTQIARTQVSGSPLVGEPLSRVLPPDSLVSDYRDELKRLITRVEQAARDQPDVSPEREEALAVEWLAWRSALAALDRVVSTKQANDGLPAATVLAAVQAASTSMRVATARLASTAAESTGAVRQYVEHLIDSTHALSACEAAYEQSALFENEIAADVGGACPDADGSATIAVFDHHFPEAARYASACEVVREPGSVDLIIERARAARAAGQPLVLVTHREPDFDALASLYLIARIAQGEDKAVGSDYVAAGITALASAFDQCRSLPVPRARSPKTVLYTLLYWERTGGGRVSGRQILETGARAFFDHLAARILDGDDPAVIDVFSEVDEFTETLARVDADGEAYAQDVARARRGSVVVPVEPFERWFEHAKATPLLDADRLAALNGQENGIPAALRCLREEHLLLGTRGVRSVDAVWIANPSCTQFKDWARDDLARSSLGQGFTFTAIAVTRKTGASGEILPDRYTFSLDPERAGDAHLYPIWAVLQASEMLASGAAETALRGEARPGFEGRRCGRDPWFDGNSFRATIVEVPGAGTRLAPPGTASAGVEHDPVMCIVEDTLAFVPFGGISAFAKPGDSDPSLGIGLATRAEIVDWTPQVVPAVSGALPGNQAISSAALPIPLRQRPVAGPFDELDEETFRFAAVPLRAVDVAAPGVARAIGERLWPLLSPMGLRDVPADFDAVHLIVQPHRVTVWSANGLAVAYRHDVRPRVGIDQESRWRAGQRQHPVIALLESGYAVARIFDGLTLLRTQLDRERAAVGRVRDISRYKDQVLDLESLIARVQLQAARADGAPVRTLFRAADVPGLLASIRGIGDQLVAREQDDRAVLLQKILAGGTAVALALGFWQVEGVSLSKLLWGVAPGTRDAASVLALVLGLALGTLFFRHFKQKIDRDSKSTDSAGTGIARVGEFSWKRESSAGLTPATYSRTPSSSAEEKAIGLVASVDAVFGRPDEQSASDTSGRDRQPSRA